MSLQEDLIASEREMWEGGPEAYLEHVDERCMVVFAGKSEVMSKEAIARTAEEGRWKDVRIEPRGFMRLDQDVASIAYDCQATRETGEPYHALVGSTYVRRGEEWKLAFHQQTMVH